MKKLTILLTALLAPTFCASLRAQVPTPGPEHERLASQVGTWDAKIEYLDFESGQPQTSKGVSVRKQPLGGFWVLDNFQAELMGQPFKGHGATGYDPMKKKYVGTWIDSMSPSVMMLEGTFDEAGKVLTMKGMGVGMDGQPAMHTMVTTILGPDKHTFEMHVPGEDGKDMKVMTITYTRRTKKLDRTPRK